MARPWPVLAALVLVAAASPELPTAGQPLNEALKLLEKQGLSIIFSTDLVRPELRVLHAPSGAPREVLDQVLAPHGLAVQPGPAGRLLVIAAPRAVAPPTPAPPSFPAQVDLVTVDAVVLDAREAPVTGLGAQDFRVFEDGEPQTIASFEAIEVPARPPGPADRVRRVRASTNQAAERDPARSFVVVYDEVHLAPVQADRARDALAAFLRTGLREGDAVTIVPTGGGAFWSGRMSAGQRDLIAFLRHLKGLRPTETSTCALGDYDAMLFHRQRDPGAEARLLRWLNECNPSLDPPVSQGDDETLRQARERRIELGIAPGRGQLQAAAAAVYERARQRRQRTLEVLARVLEGLATEHGRKVVLLVSEGFVQEPGLPQGREVAAAAARANASVYFLDTRGASLPVAHAVDSGLAVESRDLPGLLDQPQRLDDGAESVAADSGGLTLRGDLGVAWQRLAEESRAYYLLGYQPLNQRRDGGYRKLRIEVARPGLQVRARPGYHAADDAPRAAGGLDPAIRAALDLGSSGGAVPLRLAAFVLAPAPEARARTLLLAEADPAALGLREQGGRLTGSVETYAAVVSRETGAVSPLSRRLEVDAPVGSGWLALPGEMELKPGTYQARLVVRGPDGRQGAVRHEFTVPPSGLRISTPVLADALQPGTGLPAATARSSFPARGQLRCAFEIYGATPSPQGGEPRVSARHAVKRGGQVLSQSDWSPLGSGTGGVPAQVLALDLAGAEPGSYELSLEVRDEISGQVRSTQEPYQVEAVP